jgi:hypothetical protein
MGCLQVIHDVNMCGIEILTNNHFEMESNKHCELGNYIISIQMPIWMKPNTNVV